MRKSEHSRFIEEKKYESRLQKSAGGLRERLRKMREEQNSLVEEIEGILHETEGMSLREQAEEIVETLGV